MPNMSKDWTPEERAAASAAMKAAGEMSYEEFTAEIKAADKIVRFARKQRGLRFPCPRCGEWTMNEDPCRNALSRRIGVYVCDDCGISEALEAAVGAERPLASWNIAKIETWPL